MWLMVSPETPVPTGFLDLSTGVSQLEGLLERQAELESREAELNDQVGVGQRRASARAQQGQQRARPLAHRHLQTPVTALQGVPILATSSCP